MNVDFWAGGLEVIWIKKKIFLPFQEEDKGKCAVIGSLAKHHSLFTVTFLPPGMLTVFFLFLFFFFPCGVGFVSNLAMLKA